MKTAQRTTLTLVTAAAAVMLALTGCSAPATTPASSTSATTAPVTSAPTPTPTPTAAAETGQTKAEACSALTASISSIASEMSSSLSELQSDPKKAMAKLDELSDSLHDGVKEVTNADVHAAGEKADKSLAKMISSAKKIIKNPAGADTSAYMKTVTAVQEDFTAVGTTCSN